MNYEIIEAPKLSGQTKTDVRASLRVARPDMKVESIIERKGKWVVRLADFPFKDNEPKDDAEAPDEEDVKEGPEDGEKDPEDEKEDKEDKKDPKDKKGKDPVSELKGLVDQITSLLDDVVNKTDEVSQDAAEKDQKHDEIRKMVGPGEEEGGGPVGPVPGAGGPPSAAGPSGIPPIPPGPARGGLGMDKRRMPMPQTPSGVRTFTKRRTEIATHPGVDRDGNRITLTAAASELERSEDLSDYEVVGMTVNRDGTYTAKLQLRTE